jgi:oligosaccharide repeat unit polymerase
MFTLLISRPFIAVIRKSNFWYFAPKDIDFSLNGVFLSLLFLFFGILIATQMTNKGFSKSIQINNSETNKVFLQISSSLLYLVSILSTLILNIEKFLYARSTSYLDYHANFSSRMPFFIKGFSLFSTFAMCLLLATFPSRKKSLIILGLYIFSNIPTFFMGSRNSLVLSVIFSIVYLVMRGFYDDKANWVGKKEGIVVGALIPPGLIALGAMNYLRADEAVAPKGIFSLIVDFFYKQGTSFDTLSIGHKFMDSLPFSDIKLYTFGPYLDVLKYGVISQKLFGMRSMNEGNNYYRGMASYQFANNLDYVSRWKEFFQGHGFGSSFILESYVDFGYVGVAVFSMIFGIISILFLYYFRKDKPIISTVILVALISFFFLPRDAALRWSVFILKPSFWLTIFMCLIGSFILRRFKEKKFFAWLITKFS